LENLEKNSRWWVKGNELHASFMDWVVSLKPSVNNDFPWILTFSRGSGYNEELSFPCKDLESAFEKVNQYSSIKRFNDLKDRLTNDSEENDRCWVS
jgi:hypothetical protein